MKMQGPVIIKGKLEVGTLSVPAIKVQKINNKLWKPNMWLSKSKEQVINVPVVGRSVVTKQMRIKNKNHFLNGIKLIKFVNYYLVTIFLQIYLQ